MSRKARFVLITSFDIDLAEAERLAAKFESDWKNAIASLNLNDPDNHPVINWDYKEIKR